MNTTEIHLTSPGRINLIGEHIDYNDGFVLPAAIDKTIHLKFTKNGTQHDASVRSKGFDGVLRINLDNVQKSTTGWENYLLGVLHEIQQLKEGLAGFDCEIESFLPIGSGVSSSAALECGFAYGLNALFKLGLSKWDIVKLAQRAEHNFVGTKCGIMDQFASVMGKEKHAMLLDCNSLEFEYIPTNFKPYKLLLLNTNVTHNLSSGEYNVRRQQCEDALAVVQQKFKTVKNYRDVTLAMLQEVKDDLSPVLYDRSSYVVEETERVVQAVKALKQGDLSQFGAYMYQTHQGLSKKYEVSCPELDYLVALTQDEPSVLGARMMGGGFGGCTLNIIHEDAIADFVSKAATAYKSKFGIELSQFTTLPSNGTTLINS
ncbi:galactokinase [Croceivirga sp. JEA036]|uniref:galactokinase n=1 Tax=Croceivirga sp. JEA036 TaxID=2721162 RepID=UPI00143879EB|nr:galactokinase [Croceivirga sp. JEA036]NJB35254.1 galactokinase [Croceivirga sp. JEA036]